jgi:hypothetical protein
MMAALAFLRAMPWRLALYGVLMGAVLFAVRDHGVKAERARWVAKAAAQVKADADAYTAQVVREDGLVSAAIREQADLQEKFTKLEGLRYATKTQFRLDADRAVYSANRRGPTAAVACAGGVAALGAPAVLAPDGVASAPAAPGADSAGNTGPVLSLGAVWLWNAALTGQGAATGACTIDGATGQASAACASASGLDLEAAWDNHAANAAACAADRVRHQQLIDFVKTRP